MPRKGQKLTLEQRRKISEAVKKAMKEVPYEKLAYWKGKKLSEEHRRKISLALKGRTPWNKGLTKDKDPRVAKVASYGFLGKRHTEEWKRKMSLRMRGENNPLYKISEEKEKKRVRKMSETLKRKYRTGELKHPRGMLGKKRPKEWREYMSRLMKEKIRLGLLSIPSNHFFPYFDTKIERLMKEELQKRGIPFKTKRTLLGKYRPDIIIGKLLIYCDGCYWHGCPIHFPERQKERLKDIRITRELEKAGYIVLRFWEHEIIENVSGCVDKIEEVIRNSCPLSKPAEI